MQKSDLKTGDHHNIFKRSKDQKYYVTKVEQKKLYIFYFNFYGVSHTKTDLHNKYIFNFVSGSFFEQDNLLNLFNLGVYAKKMT